MKIILVLLVGLFSVSAIADGCDDQLKARIDFAYNEGGLQVKNMIGPIYWNEGVTDSQGNFGLDSKVAFAVTFDEDPAVIPGGQSNINTVISAICEHAEPSYPRDVNGDGIFTLLDAVTKGN